MRRTPPTGDASLLERCQAADEWMKPVSEGVSKWCLHALRGLEPDQCEEKSELYRKVRHHLHFTSQASLPLHQQTACREGLPRPTAGLQYDMRHH